MGAASDLGSTESLRANGLLIHYHEAGEGPLVVCLHGFPDTAATFGPQMEALAGAGYRVVAPFLRGYAPTEVSAGGYEAANLARDVLGLIEALGAEKAAVVGHDWGSAIGMGAARLAPERVRKLVAVSVPHPGVLMPALVGHPIQRRRSWYMFYFQMPFADDAVALDDFGLIEGLYADWSPGWQVPAAHLERVKETFRQPGVTKAALDYYRYQFNPTLHDPELAGVQEELFQPPVTVPTLYLHGADDACVGAEVAAGMETVFAGGFEMAVIEGAGHWPHLEATDEFNRRVIDFLSE